MPDNELLAYIKSRFPNADEEAVKDEAGKFEVSLTRRFRGTAYPDLTLPEAAPELYANRPIDPATRRPEKAIDFYNRVWKIYADAGLLFQDQLRKRDPKIIEGIYGQCRNYKIDAHSVLPPPLRDRTDAVAYLHKRRRYRHRQYDKT